MRKLPLYSLFFIITGFLSCNNNLDNANVFDITKYGAKGDGITDDTQAIQKAISDCSEAGGGTVVFPSGKTYMSGPLELKSFVNLYFEPNSILLANPDEDIYKLSAFKENEGEGMMWLWGKDIENFTITGNGKIDGNGISFMGEEREDYYDLKPVTTFDPRPHVLTLINSKNIKIRDINIGNSAYWTIHLIGCYDIAISDITLLNNLKVRNGDGIDIDHSKKVRISGCYIESGDDGICLKNRREYEGYGPCRDIVVSNCILTSRSCAIKIGSENCDTIDNVLFNNCIITDSNRGVGIQNRDEGVVQDIIFSNMLVDCHLYSDIWWGKSEAIYVTSYPRASINHKDANWRFPKGATEGKSGEIRDITFSNIICRSENGIFLGCDQQGKISDITFDNVAVNIIKLTNYTSGILDKRPCKGEGFITTIPVGIYAENISGVILNDFKVNGAKYSSFNNCKKIQQ